MEIGTSSLFYKYNSVLKNDGCYFKYYDFSVTEVTRSFRYVAPAHFSLVVENFSSISEIDKYESGTFEAGGYNWKLLFYPNGDGENGGENHISLYLAIVTTDSLPLHWEVYVNFKLFVHNQIEDKYLMIQDHTNGGVKRFSPVKTMWGFSQLIELKTFKDSSSGYIMRDSCVFGAEVFVIKHTGKRESLSIVKAPEISKATFTWEIEKFSEIKEYTESPVFTVGEQKWKLWFYPKGTKGYAGKSLSLYLGPGDWKSQIPTKAGVHAKYKLRVVDQINGKHAEAQFSYSFSTSSGEGYGSRSLISLEDLQKLSNGLVRVKDCVTVEVEFLAITMSTYS